MGNSTMRMFFGGSFSLSNDQGKRNDQILILAVLGLIGLIIWSKTFRRILILGVAAIIPALWVTYGPIDYAISDNIKLIQGLGTLGALFVCLWAFGFTVRTIIYGCRWIGAQIRRL